MHLPLCTYLVGWFFNDFVILHFIIEDFHLQEVGTAVKLDERPSVVINYKMLHSYVFHLQYICNQNHIFALQCNKK